MDILHKVKYLLAGYVRYEDPENKRFTDRIRHGLMRGVPVWLNSSVVSFSRRSGLKVGFLITMGMIGYQHIKGR